MNFKNEEATNLLPSESPPTYEQYSNQLGDVPLLQQSSSQNMQVGGIQQYPQGAQMIMEAGGIQQYPQGAQMIMQAGGIQQYPQGTPMIMQAGGIQQYPQGAQMIMEAGGIQQYPQGTPMIMQAGGIQQYPQGTPMIMQAGGIQQYPQGTPMIMEAGGIQQYPQGTQMIMEAGGIQQYPQGTPMIMQAGGIQQYPQGAPMIMQAGGIQQYPQGTLMIMQAGGIQQYPQGTPMIMEAGGIQQNPQTVYNPQFIQVPNPTKNDVVQLKFPRRHFGIGISFIIIGIITCIIDPMIPIFTRYPHSIMPAGIFMIISGATSISGSKLNNKCHLIVSLVFDILASINLGSGFITAMIAVSNYFYQGYARFSLINCGVLFGLVIWDSTLKCQETCCGIRQKTANEVYIYPTSNVPQ